jgi:hypothetical protein
MKGVYNMKVGFARKTAAEWVRQHVGRKDWFRGAYFSGSTIGLPDDEELPEASDVDIVIVTDQDEPPLKLGKFVHRGTLLEVTYLSRHELATAERVLTNYHLAGSFRKDTIISDPTGHLHTLQAEVSHHFADRKWVRRRCEHARQKVENGLRNIDTSAPWHDQVMAWLFSTGVTTHVLLVAALVVAVLMLLGASSPARASTTFTVTNTGPSSLRMLGSSLSKAARSVNSDACGNPAPLAMAAKLARPPPGMGCPPVTS